MHVAQKLVSNSTLSVLLATLRDLRLVKFIADPYKNTNRRV